MNTNHLSFQRFAAIAAILSAPLAFGNVLVGMLATNFSPDAFGNPDVLLNVTKTGATLLRWSFVLDMLGYYIFIAPLTLLLWFWLREKDAKWMSFFTLLNLAYILIGSIGASILAAILPPLVRDYALASAQEQEVIKVILSTLFNMVYGGLWNLLELFLAGIGWVGIGLLLRRERPALGIATIILGVASLVDSIGTMSGVTALAQGGLAVYLIFAPIWAAWLGITLLRRPIQLAESHFTGATYAPGKPQIALG